MARTRTFGAGRRAGQLGFTLLELMVVLAVIGLVTGLAVPQFSGSSKSADLGAAAREIAASLRFAGSEAVRRNESIAVVFDLEKRMLRVADEPPRELAPDLLMQLYTAKSELVSDTVGSVRFFPDGSSTGGRMRLARSDNEDARVDIRIDWLSGRVEVAR